MERDRSPTEARWDDGGTADSDLASEEDGVSKKPLRLSQWLRLCEWLDPLGEELPRRTLVLCYVRSRNDARHDRRRAFGFEEFAEAVSRLALQRALPTHEDLASEGCRSAAGLFARLLAITSEKECKQAVR
eukprot:5392950-Prymnesium_polylepis.1